MGRMSRCLFAVAALLAGAGAVSAQQARPFADLLVHLLAIQPGMTVADLGAGNGEFAFRLADAVGPTGRVYANEITADAIAGIERARRTRGVSNVTAIVGIETDPRLPEPVDRLIMIDVYHHLAKPEPFMARLQQYLKPGGRLAVAAVVNKRNPAAKPSTSQTHDPCVSDPEETRKAIEQAGWTFETLVLHEDPARSYFWTTSYVLVFRRPASSDSPVPFRAPSQRATLIGTRTAGAGHVVASRPVGYGFTLPVSITCAVSSRPAVPGVRAVVAVQAN